MAPVSSIDLLPYLIRLFPGSTIIRVVDTNRYVCRGGIIAPEALRMRLQGWVDAQVSGLQVDVTIREDNLVISVT